MRFHDDALRTQEEMRSSDMSCQLAHARQRVKLFVISMSHRTVMIEHQDIGHSSNESDLSPAADGRSVVGLSGQIPFSSVIFLEIASACCISL